MQMNVSQPGMNPMNVNMNYYNQTVLPPKQLPNVDNILFVADLPEEACEEDLANFFKAYNFSFAKVFHNVMRTHAFVTFNTVEDAEKARLELNGVKITAKYSNSKISKPVRLCKYETKQGQGDIDRRTNLLVKNVAKEVSPHALFNAFRHYGDIRSCKLVVDYLGNTKGYGYVSYYRVEDAERAISELNGREMQGKPLKVNHLEHGRRIEKRRNNIYVKHIPKDNFNDEDLEKLFAVHGEIKSAIVLKDQNGASKGFGFVCFDKPEDAEEAYKQMNGTTIWKDIPAIYVNFAMKKSERLEHLQKKREEMFKNAQKMTIFTKIKDENAVKSEQDFENQIKYYLKVIFGKDYEPKSIKIRFETKNAFITMNSQRDSEEFIRKFQDFSKDNQTTLFFNLYKSKVERISANAYFKKYNNFTKPQEGQQGRYRTYNEFNAGNQKMKQGEFPMSSINQMQQPMRFNNFDDQNPMNPRYVSYNNFNQMPQPIPQKEMKPQQIVFRPPELDPTDEDSIGEYLYNFVEGFYPE